RPCQSLEPVRRAQGEERPDPATPDRRRRPTGDHQAAARHHQRRGRPAILSHHRFPRRRLFWRNAPARKWRQAIAGRRGHWLIFVNLHQTVTKFARSRRYSGDLWMKTKRAKAAKAQKTRRLK